jgi:mRNA interferase RelE/StbE
MFNIIFDKKAAIYFKKLDLDDKKRIGKKLEDLKNNPKLGKSLTGNLSGLWSLRIGKFRLVYQIKHQELIIFILDLGHRKNVYG